MLTRSRRHGRRLPAVALLATLAAALAGCDDREPTAAKAAPSPGAEKRGTLTLTPDEARRAGLRIETLRPSAHVETTSVFGTAEPNRDRLARVLPPVAGRIARIAAALGDRVEAGALLAVLESPELGDARSLYQQARAEVELARTGYERTRSLLSGGAVAEKDAQRSRSDYDKAQATLTAAAAKLTNLGVSPSAPAGASTAALAVTAPFAGTVIEKPAVVGEYAQAYQALFTVADLSSLWIETNLYDRDLGEVSVGAPAKVTVNAYPDRRFDGRVTYISSLLDKDTRTVKARVEVANPEDRLKPGMFADVLIEKGSSGEVLRVPETALVLLQGQMTAFVQDGDGFVPRPVETSERAGGEITVTSGLEAGDQVVVAGVYALKARLLRALIADVD